MKEIKFRVWNKVTKQMVDLSENGEIGWMHGWMLITPDCQKPEEVAGEELYDLMQYTGLNDKNGKEIYFDDIVRFTFYDADDRLLTYSGTAVITETMSYGVGLLFNFKDETGVEVEAVLEGGQMEEYWPDEGLWTIEVIGNIYQNKDLIKEVI